MSSHFGAEARQCALDAYSRGRNLGEEPAWSHIYKLLLGVDARTGLAGVYDSSHMQPGGSFHDRAVEFTQSLCALWDIESDELAAYLDFLLRECSAGYAKASKSQLDPTESDLTGQFIVALRGVELSRNDDPGRFRVAKSLAAVAHEFVAIERKRANVRGEGFADVLRWTLERLGGIPREYLDVRVAATVLLPGADKKTNRADLVVWDYDHRRPLAIVFAKWSYRHDRLDHIAKSAGTYKEGFAGSEAPPLIALVTNELDIPRIRLALDVPALDLVRLVNLDLTKSIQGKRWESDLVAREANGQLGDFGAMVHDLAARWRAGETE